MSARNRFVGAMSIAVVSLVPRSASANHNGEGGFLLIVLGVALLVLLGLSSFVASLVLIAKVRRGGASPRARTWCRRLAWVNVALSLLTLVPLFVDPHSTDSFKGIPGGIALALLAWLGLRSSR